MRCPIPIWKWLIVGLTVWLVCVLAGCIPVTIRPERDSQGLPIAIPVTAIGSVSPDGSLVPIYPVSKETPSAPPSLPWGTILAVAGAVAGGGWGAVAMRVAAKAKTALSLACRLADEQTAIAERVAEESGNEQVKANTGDLLAANKRAAAALQEHAGVRKVTQRARGKA